MVFVVAAAASHKLAAEVEQAAVVALDCASFDDSQHPVVVVVGRPSEVPVAVVLIFVAVVVVEELGVDLFKKLVLLLF